MFGLAEPLIVYLNRVYFAAKDTKRPMVVGIISVVFHIAFCWVAVDRMGYLGIALGTSLYALMYVVLLGAGIGFAHYHNVSHAHVEDLVHLCDVDVALFLNESEEGAGFP